MRAAVRCSPAIGLPYTCSVYVRPWPCPVAAPATSGVPTTRVPNSNSAAPSWAKGATRAPFNRDDGWRPHSRRPLPGSLRTLGSSAWIASALMTEALRVERRSDGITLLTLALPERRNAMTAELTEAWRVAIGDLAADGDVRCVVV